MYLFRRGWRLKKARLVETTDVLPNPAAGWYRIYKFPLEVPAEQLERQWHLEPTEQLAFLMVNIGAFQCRELDQQALQNLEKGLEYFFRSGKDLIVRAAYDGEGKGIQSEPAQFDRVTQHMQQLVEVLQKYQSGIFVYQGMLLGSWGEMHSSRFLTKPRMKALLTILEQLESPFLAVRRPVFYRMLRKNNGPQERKLGLFDDAILASQTDMGTFGWESRKTAPWETAWLPEEELEFEEELCRLVPQGGEALLPEIGELPLKETVARLKQMHITYLNSQYDPAVLDIWRRQRWGSGDVWNRMSGYDYIGRHLGYRLCIRDVFSQIEEGKLRLYVVVENVGFAPLYQPCEMRLVQINQEGKSREIPMRGNLLGLTQGLRTMMADIPDTEKSRIFTRLHRLSDGREIQFATCTSQQPEGTDSCGLFLGTLE